MRALPYVQRRLAATVRRLDATRLSGRCEVSGVGLEMKGRATGSPELEKGGRAGLAARYKEFGIRPAARAICSRFPSPPRP